MMTDNSKKSISIVTPVVWAEPGLINDFAYNMNNLIDKINTLFEACKEKIDLKKSHIYIYSVQRENSTILQFKNVVVHYDYKSKEDRKNMGMGHWWYSSVEECFRELDKKEKAIAYLPIDIAWCETNTNTLINPARMCGFLKSIADSSDSETLIIGNYESTNKNKDLIENEVLTKFREKFRKKFSEKLGKIDIITRVRTEFWGISRSLFENFNSIYYKKEQYPFIKDPTILLLMFCIENNKKIIPYDLGIFDALGEYSSEKMREQIERAVNLINQFPYF